MQQVLREAMDAGAAGFATSFALAAPGHRRQAGAEPVRRPRRARGAARDDGRGRPGRGRRSRPASSAAPADMFDLQLKVGVPFTWGALLTSPDRAPPPGDRARTGPGWEHGAEVWPQVTPRPLTFPFTLDSPYPLTVNAALRRADDASIDERTRAYADPAWRERDDERLERGRQLRSPLGHLHDRRRARRTPSSSTASCVDVAAERGTRTARLPARPRARRARTRAAGAHACSPTTTRTGSPISWSRSTARSACPTPARTSASSATRRRPPTCSATGCATRA